ncbi:hypothetical protein AB0D54_02775 [Streptomyces xanthophaeus]|uniref:hypothetical protein n=1 Tax=Streptomyces xanthophaeus TaxID=67385 RepID=UPI00344624FF
MDVRGDPAREDSCMRALCCGYQRKEAVPEYVTPAGTERADLERMAYERGLYLGDLIGALVRLEIEKWRKERPAESTGLGS